MPRRSSITVDGEAEMPPRAALNMLKSLTRHQYWCCSHLAGRVACDCGLNQAINTLEAYLTGPKDLPARRPVEQVELEQAAKHLIEERQRCCNAIRATMAKGTTQLVGKSAIENTLKRLENSP